MTIFLVQKKMSVWYVVKIISEANKVIFYETILNGRS